MFTRSLGRFAFLLAGLTLAALLAFAACDDEEEAPPAGETPVAGVAPELQDGTLTIGSDIAYAPMEFFEEGTNNATGMDVELAEAMGKILGVKVEFQQVADFAGIVGDLKAKRYDIVMSSISITPEREAEIDLIPYFGPTGTGILVKTGNPKGLDKIEDLCGLPIAAQVGTVQVDYMNDVNKGACAGNPIDIKTFPDNPTAVQELTLGRVDAELADDPVAAYSALQSDGELEVVAPRFDSAPYGIGVRKDSPELKAALEQALKQIRDDGTYDDILQKWGQEEFAIQ